MTIAEDFSTQTARLKQLYSFDEPDKITTWLEKYPFLVPLLYEAHSKIRHYFPDASLYLELFRFYDTSLEETVLLVNISPSGSSEEAAAVKEQFDWDWWLDVSDQAQDKLEIMVQYR